MSMTEDGEVYPAGLGVLERIENLKVIIAKFGWLLRCRGRFSNRGNVDRQTALGILDRDHAIQCERLQDRKQHVLASGVHPSEAIS